MKKEPKTRRSLASWQGLIEHVRIISESMSQKHGELPTLKFLLRMIGIQPEPACALLERDCGSYSSRTIRLCWSIIGSIEGPRLSVEKSENRLGVVWYHTLVRTMSIPVTGRLVQVQRQIFAPAKSMPFFEFRLKFCHTSSMSPYDGVTFLFCMLFR